jgi:hypothetical protein
LVRDHCGTLRAFDDAGRLVCGPFPVAGRASDRLARLHGNPARDPRLPYGDTPCGSYGVVEKIGTGARTPFSAKYFGGVGALVIEARTGDAALAEANGRFRFLVQGGATGNDGSLCATAGALRLEDRHLRLLIDAKGETTEMLLVVSESKTVAIPKRRVVETDGDYDDPPSVLPNQNGSRVFAQTISRRATLRAGAIGMNSLAALSIAGPFFALGMPAAASVRLAYAEPAQETPPPTEEPGDTPIDPCDVGGAQENGCKPKAS